MKFSKSRKTATAKENAQNYLYLLAQRLGEEGNGPSLGKIRPLLFLNQWCLLHPRWQPLGWVMQPRLCLSVSRYCFKMNVALYNPENGQSNAYFPLCAHVAPPLTWKHAFLFLMPLCRWAIKWQGGGHTRVHKKCALNISIYYLSGSGMRQASLLLHGSSPPALPPFDMQWAKAKSATL